MNSHQAKNKFPRSIDVKSSSNKSVSRYIIPTAAMFFGGAPSLFVCSYNDDCPDNSEANAIERCLPSHGTAKPVVDVVKSIFLPF